MSKQIPCIDFDCDDRDVTIDSWLKFWDSSRPWLLDRGYTLYENGYHWGDEYWGDVTCAVPKAQATSNAEYPYALSGGDEMDTLVPSLSANVVGRVAFAQDSLHRHVTMKLTKENSSEYQIARLLSREMETMCLENFTGVLPVIDFLHFANHVILVMPRWGQSVLFPWFSTIDEVICYMRCWLKGLTFLHENRIIHRDIKIGNSVVNHFASFTNIEENSMRRKLRNEGRLVYAIIDFDLSMIFPPSASTGDCRLHSDFSGDGGNNQPRDTRQGELDYNPFIYDVGCLGVLFCEEFQHLTTLVPMFAPLMDRMTTRDLGRRFTAKEALDFLESFATNLTTEELQLSPPTWDEPAYYDYETFDRWKLLPEQFVREWDVFRETKPSFQIKVLRRICGFEWGRSCVQWVRRFLRHGSRLSEKLRMIGRGLQSRLATISF